MRNLLVLAMLFAIVSTVPALISNQPKEKTLIQLQGDFLDNLVRSLLPFGYDSSEINNNSGSKLYVSDALYCGANNNNGRYLARGTFSKVYPTYEEAHLSHDMCVLELKEVATKLCKLGLDGIAFKLEVKWRPWSIDIVMTEIAYTENDNCINSSLAKKSVNLMSIATGPIDIQSTIYPDQYYVSLAYSDKFASIQIYPTSEIDDIEVAPQNKIRESGDSFINSAIFLPLTLVNRYLPILTAAQPLSLKLDTQIPGIPQEVKLIDMQVLSSAGDLAEIVGNIVTDKAGVYDVKIGLNNDDLSVRDIQIKYKAEKCENKPILQKIECEARNQLRTGLGNDLAVNLSEQFANVPVVPFGTSSLMRMQLEGRKIDFIGIPKNTRIYDGVISMEAFIAVETLK